MAVIVVGVDGSDGSALALAWAADEARRRSATLRVVHCWHIPYIGGYPFLPAPVDPAVFESAARHVLDDAIAGLDMSAGLHVEKVLVLSSPATALLAESDGADLVVVGARGLGGFKGLLLGSVSAQVVHHAACPVVVVPTPH